MANQTFNTRIKVKFDTLKNWLDSSLVLLAGELAIADVVTSETKKDANGIPVETEKHNYLIKVGNGSQTFAELSWASALAADVYDWAKQPNKPTYNATEIAVDGSDNAEKVSDALSDIQESLKSMNEGLDTNTIYQIIETETGKFTLQSKDGKAADAVWANVQVDGKDVIIDVSDFVTNGSLATALEDYVLSEDFEDYKTAQSTLNESFATKDYADQAEADAIAAAATDATQKANAAQAAAIEAAAADATSKANTAEANAK